MVKHQLKTLGIILFGTQFLFLSNEIVRADTCVEIGNPAGDFFPNSYCVTQDPGSVGDPANIQITESPFRVPVDSRLDMIIPMTKGVKNLSAVTYSSHFSWTTPVDPVSIRVQERAIRFPKVIAPSIDTNDPVLIDGFSWTLNDNDLAIGWQVENKSFSDVSPDSVMDHYHITTQGLPADEVVTFSHQMFGGTVVVPEPAGHVLSVIWMAAAFFVKRRM